MSSYEIGQDALMHERQRLVDATKEIFETPAGEIVLDQLKAKSGFNVSNFTNDALEMAFREGQRSVVLYILNLMSEEKLQQQQGD
tara:strand:+ start:6368 stop:6622 length:255 start_codon:yes stop_codon:yes gene_type:complete